MKKALGLVSFSILFVGLSYAAMVYFKQNRNTISQKRDFLILAEHDGADIITSLRSAIAPLINTIIQQELNLSEADKSPSFKTPPHHNLTLYYVFDWLSQKDDLLTQAVDSAFAHKAISAFEVMLGQPAFFGMNNDEIVVKINDLEGFLSKINIDLKHALASSHALYNVKKSEYFPYVPHIALGRLPANDKRYFSSDEGQNHLNNIKQRIEHEVFPVIVQKLKSVGKKLYVTALCIYDVQQKSKIKSCYFENKI